MIQSFDEPTILEWAQRTFPDSYPESLIEHIEEELGELRYALECSLPGDVLEEIGDLGLMLIHLASMYDSTLNECVLNKFATASLRTYEYDEAKGYRRHVEESGT